MSVYNSLSIKSVIDDVNKKYFLPIIQRELVWKPKQIIALFDSILREYPIGTFLFWRVKGNDNDIQKLEFLKNYDKGVKKEYNESTNLGECWLVLDGQQRIQSLYIALNGKYQGKDLFFNALSSDKTVEEVIEEEAETENEEESEIKYETKFFKRKESYFLDESDDHPKKLWVKIKFLDFEKEDKNNALIHEIRKKFNTRLLEVEGDILSDNLKKLRYIIASKPTLAYYLEEENDFSKVLDIFIRTNSGGTKLSKSDLLFSIIKKKLNL